MYSSAMFTFVVALKSGPWGFFNIDSACKLKINDGRCRHQTIFFLVTMVCVCVNLTIMDVKKRKKDIKNDKMKMKPLQRIIDYLFLFDG